MPGGSSMPGMTRLGRHSRRLKELRQRVRRRRPGEVVVDGRRLLADLVRWQVALDELYLGERVAAETGTAELTAAAAQVWLVADDVLESIAPTRHPQGVLAVIAEPSAQPWPATTTGDRSGLALFLDRLQDPGNIGAIVRSAAGLGADAVLLSPDCADPFHPAAVRGSAGAVLRLPPVRDVDPATVAALVERRGGEVWAADTTGVAVDRWQPAALTLLLLGAEGSGLDESTAALTEKRVTIPLDRDLESLNVAVAAALLVHTWTASRAGRTVP